MPVPNNTHMFRQSTPHHAQALLTHLLVFFLNQPPHSSIGRLCNAQRRHDTAQHTGMSPPPQRPHLSRIILIHPCKRHLGGKVLPVAVERLDSVISGGAGAEGGRNRLGRFNVKLLESALLCVNLRKATSRIQPSTKSRGQQVWHRQRALANSASNTE